MKVAVFGSRGQMGRTTCAALEAADGFAVHAEIDLGDPTDAVIGADAAVVFTSPAAAMPTLETCVAAGVPTLVGTTGFDEQRIDMVRDLIGRTPGSTVMIVPNFSIGAALMMRWAAAGASYFPSVEIIEEHHANKVDAPSGTARRTAELIGQARGTVVNPDATAGSDDRARGDLVAGVPIHSIRMPGKLAHQEVIFGGLGETLTIRHDSTDRASFMPGVLLALRELHNHPGLTIGLERILGLDE
jgi:4-hydroxy-tetrahydrodipicolinate reductase